MADDKIVSIGLPVYNGENYLSFALDGLLSQSYENIEILISDNASTDATEKICRNYADKDKRIRYSRNPENIGASGNYTRSFEMASGTYFKWAAHDDICLPDFISSCVAALEDNPKAVLAYPHTAAIGADGELLRKHEPVTGFEADSPTERFSRALHLGDEIFLVWGLMPRNILLRTGLLGNFIGHDRALLSGLALLGTFVQVPGVHLYQREHVQRSVNLFDWRNPQDAMSWYDPSMAGRRIFPWWRLLAEHYRSIRRGNLPVDEKGRCLSVLGRWMLRNRRNLLGEIMAPLAHNRYFRRAMEFSNPQIYQLVRVIPEDANFLFADMDELQTDYFYPRTSVPFTEHNGMYWGPPRDTKHAVGELEKARLNGADYAVFAQPAFWLLDYYSGFRGHLEANYRLVFSSQYYIIYELNRKV